MCSVWDRRTLLAAPVDRIARHGQAYGGAVSESDWRDEPLFPEQTEDDIDREPSDNDDRLREDVPPHHGD